MDYVYICRQGDNEELRYSIRSIEKNMPSSSIWVIGYRPEWYIGNFIKINDVGTKFDNIKNCIRKIPEIDTISENFILMNDDFFALKKIDTFKNFHGGYLEDKINRYKESKMSNKYIKLLELTNKQLKNYGIDNPIDYDIHVPITMNKEKLESIIDVAYFPRSTYGNLVKLDASPRLDVKIYSNKKYDIDIETLDFISTEDQSFIKIKDSLLKKIFSEKSSLENPNY